MALPKKTGLILAITHVIILIVSAIWIVLDNSRDPESPMFWMFVAWLDLPGWLLAAPLFRLVESWPHVLWLPGLVGDWPNFLFPLLSLGVFGTIWWFFVGWGIAWSWCFFRRPR